MQVMEPEPDGPAGGYVVLRVRKDVLPADAGYSEAGTETHLIPFVRPIISCIDSHAEVRTAR